MNKTIERILTFFYLNAFKLVTKNCNSSLLLFKISESVIDFFTSHRQIYVFFLSITSII